jgi:hypothetical protein
MRNRSTLWIATASVLALLVAGAAVAEEQTEGQTETSAAMQLGAPGEHHKHLDRQAGSWDFTAKVWGPLGGEPMESTGTIEATWIMGGRFLKQELTTTLMDMPIQGIAIDGYDNLGKQYVGVWMDNMETGIMQFEGSCDMSGKVRTMFAEAPNPMNPDQMQTTKGVTTILNDNSYMYEQYIVHPDGTEFKTMELVAKRRK